MKALLTRGVYKCCGMSGIFRVKYAEFSMPILEQKIGNIWDTGAEIAADDDRMRRRVFSSFCVDTLKEAISKYGCPEIFNTDQGSQFTAEAFTDTLHSRGVAISMDGKGRWMDNVFIERFWKSVKYEDIYLKAYGSMAEVKKGHSRYDRYINYWSWTFNKVLINWIE